MIHWAKERGVVWHEAPQTGVVRGLKSRDGWARLWKQRMVEPLAMTPVRAPSLRKVDPGHIPDPKEVGVEETTKET
ncbi:MAG: hypothetical protein MK312_11950, partial [Roseibacillus sp.]|nr:hypothetical protein [Roseibacillus sp.]